MKRVAGLIAMAVMWGAYFVFMLCAPVLSNHAAMSQLESSDAAYVGFTAYQNIYNWIVGYGWIVLILLTILVFSDGLIKLLKGKK